METGLSTYHESVFDETVFFCLEWSNREEDLWYFVLYERGSSSGQQWSQSKQAQNTLTIYKKKNPKPSEHKWNRQFNHLVGHDIYRQSYLPLNELTIISSLILKQFWGWKCTKISKRVDFRWLREVRQFFLRTVHFPTELKEELPTAECCILIPSHYILCFIA